MKKFHRVVVKRYHRDGMLKLDDYEDVAGQSQGSLKALDLVEDAYIGYVPTNVTKWVQVIEWHAECTAKLVHEHLSQFIFLHKLLRNCISSAILFSVSFCLFCISYCRCNVLKQKKYVHIFCQHTVRWSLYWSFCWVLFKSSFPWHNMWYCPSIYLELLIKTSQQWTLQTG